jgi:hypothetical protein
VKKIKVKTKKKINNPALLSGALESMGFLTECTFNGNKHENKNGYFDLNFEDSEGQKVRGFNLHKWLESRQIRK